MKGLHLYSVAPGLKIQTIVHTYVYWGDVPSYDAMAKLDAEHEKMAEARRKQAEKGIGSGADE